MSNLSVSAATVVLDDKKRVLLVQRDDNKQWQIPGGVVELGEQPTDAAVRETLEETGVIVDDLELTGCYTNIKRGIVAFVFAARAVGGSPATSEESIAVEYLEVGEALRRVPEVFRKRIEDAVSPNEGVQFRAHDGVEWISS